MIMKRDFYLNKLISKKDNGFIKIITGIRRCGKSYLLFHLYDDYLKRIGIDQHHIIKLSLEEFSNVKYRNPIELDTFIREQCSNENEKYYVFIDEIQFVHEIQNPYINDPTAIITFVDVVLGLMKLDQIDLYITGSNSKMLSSDIVTQFRDRGDEIKLYPLSFKEFSQAYDNEQEAWVIYYTYGGMPRLLSLKTHEEKSKYLKDLFKKLYISDIMERNNIRKNEDVLEELINIISSNIGSLTNPTKLSNTFQSKKHITIKSETIVNYLNYFIEAFIIEKTLRYDVKGKKYIKTPTKYYFTDVGLRNARLNFRQTEENHIMKNIIYNELIRREFDVDVGVVNVYAYNSEGKRKMQHLEVDFVARKGSKRYYIQSALTVASEDKRLQEIKSLINISDSFKKIVVVKDHVVPWNDEFGILYIGIEEFLLNEHSLDL